MKYIIALAPIEMSMDSWTKLRHHCIVKTTFKLSNPDIRDYSTATVVTGSAADQQFKKGLLIGFDKL